MYLRMYVCTHMSVILLVLVAPKPRDTIITALCSDLTKSIRAPPSFVGVGRADQSSGADT